MAPSFIFFPRNAEYMQPANRCVPKEHKALCLPPQPERSWRQEQRCTCSQLPAAGKFLRVRLASMNTAQSVSSLKAQPFIPEE